MINIARPMIEDEEKAAVMAVLESGQLVQGSVVAELEEKFAEYCGVKHAIATSNGTTALHVAILAHEIGPGDEVITTPFTFIASANSMIYAGAKPVFVDIEPDSFNIDPEQIEAAITPRTKAIMPIHLYGNPAKMSQIMEIAERHGLAIIEDAAQAHGAEENGKRAGSWGTGCFSFYGTKNMTTGEGGMITTNDDCIADRARLIRSHGMRKRYYHEMLGYNFRMTNILAAIGVAQLAKLERFNEQRIANAEYLSEHLPHDIVDVPQVRPGTHHVFHQYTVRIRPPLDRDVAREKLAAAGVGTEVYYPVPVHKQQLYIELGYGDQSFPESERASKEVMSLPVHPGLSQEDLETIVRAVVDLRPEEGQGQTCTD
jgi:perosamine synthetase